MSRTVVRRISDRILDRILAPIVGRTWGRVWVLALAAAAFGGACTNGDDPGPPVPVEPAVIYAQMCARCHGSDGHGDAELKKTLPVRDFHDPAFRARASTEEIVRVVMAGKGQMPAFGGSLSLPKMQALSGYVRRLGASGAP